ncbi:MAG TPA: amino acid adenylation domain-containing protein [Urbifossiella sp.]|jgi:non-ribosomal peptide synthetase-like protein|nr:amino acid adenylation domain-containing protein [Urbifossiella sp.]
MFLESSAAPQAHTPLPVSPPEPTLLHEFFTRSAHRWGDRVAVDVPPSASRPDRRTVTYAELDRLSDGLAARLRKHVAGECVVAVLLPRTSEHIYLAQLAVLKAGAAYVCIDPTFPDAQIGHILADARPVAVLTDAPGAARLGRLPQAPDTVHDVVGWAAGFDGPAGPLPPAAWLSPRSLAYLIYTSGTTGRPKGVMIEHAGIVNLVRGDTRTYPVAPDDRVGQNSSCAYDSSVEEVWMAFANGAALVVMDDETTRLGPDLVGWLADERVTVFCPPPTLLRTTGCARPDLALPRLRRVHVGGEALPADVAARWAPGRALVNDYGPTECSVVALRGIIAPDGPVSIGRPVPGTIVWVLDEALAEVPAGEPGELCLGGAGLARGYMNDPDMTARKFPVHPRFGRIYRTGDLARRNPDGTYDCLGRIDAQVKVRGFRIELEAVEARLAECPGVREAACRVQGEGPAGQIVAFLVPHDPAAPPHFDEVKAALRQLLPEYMVPSHFGLLPALPTTTGGKLNRRALPTLDVHTPDDPGHAVAPRDAAEAKVAAAVGRVLDLTAGVSVELDFFHDLGGDSLRAALLISLLREDPETAGLAVRDLYEARTVAGLAARVRRDAGPTVGSRPERRRGRPLLATAAQTVWLLLMLVAGGPVAYLLAFEAVPELARSLGLIPFLLASPLLALAGMVAYTVAALGFAVLMKRTLIGRYRPRREPVWGGFYVRNWVVQQAVRLVPWGLLNGTVLQNAALRLLGARIGARVHIHRGVDLLRGGWDLLDIGDDATIGQEAALRLIELEDGQVVVGPVTLGRGSTVDTRAGVGPGAALEPDAYLTPLSFLAGGTTIPRGERWEGVPAVAAGTAPARAELPPGTRELPPAVHAAVLLAARLALALFVALPLEGLAVALALVYGVDVDGVAAWLLHPSMGLGAMLLGCGLVALAVPVTLVFECLALRFLGPVRPGVVGRWSLAYVRVWLKTGVVDSANTWLSGTLLWRAWLRAAGMKIGRNSEVGTILDTVPELVEIGSGTFFADGVYLAGPRVHQGAVALAVTRLGDGVFLGNHAVIPAGATVPDDVLLGVATVADDALLRPGTSWFGHPPFELPNREVVEADRRFTHEPSWPRYINRVVWELARFALPVFPVLLGLAWVEAVAAAEGAVPTGVLLFGVVPTLDFAFAAVLALVVLGMKWALLGRVRPGTHPLWSCWCSRWDFHYAVWEVYGRAPLTALEGTLWLNWYLRAMGVTIGREVVLGPGFAHVVDPDMLTFADGATVSALFQAHTFEDRVLKIDRVVVGPRATVGGAAVLLYGADIGADTRVVPHSVVMKRERLLPNRTYGGCPTRPV